MDRFDQAVESVVGVGPPAPAADPIDAAAGAVVDGQRTAVRSSLYGALMANPDVAARATKIGRQIGLPADVVQRNLPDVERNLALDRVERVLLENPSLAKKLAERQFASMAHDDVPMLDEVTKAVRLFLDSGAMVRRPLGGGPNALEKMGGAAASGLVRASAGAVGLAQAPVDLMTPVGDLLAGTILPENPLRRVAAGLSDYRQSLEAEAKRRMPKADGNIEAGFYSGLGSLASNLASLPLAFLPGGQSAALSAMVAPVFGGAFGEARDKNIAPTTAAAFGASQAAIEYATERMPLTKLLDDFKAGSSLGRMVLDQLKSEVPREQVATLLQDLNEWAVLNPDKPFKAYLQERPSAAVQTLVATMVGVGGQVGVVRGIDTALGAVAGRDRRAERAEAAAQEVQQVIKAAEATRLKARDSETFKSYVEQVAADNGGDTPAEFYVSAEQLANSLKQSALTIEELRAVAPELVAQVEAAAAIPGADVRIPMAEFVAAPARLSESLVDHLRETPESMSRAEARQYMSEQGDRIRAEVEAEIAKSQQAGEVRQQIDAIRDEFRQQLEQIGRYDQRANEAFADFLASFYGTQAMRAGMTPAEFARKYSLSVVRSGGAVRRGNAVNQGGAFNAPMLVDSRTLEFRESEQNRTEAVRELFAPGEYFPIVTILEPNGDRLILDGHNRTVVALDRGDQIPIVDVTRSEYERLTNAGYDVLEIAYAALERARQYEAASGLANMFVGSGMVERGAEAGNLLDDHNMLSQGIDGTDARAALLFDSDITNRPSVIELYEKADWSSFIHESGHWFLEVQADLARRIQTQISSGESVSDSERGIVDDFNRILEWFGIKGDENVTALDRWTMMSLAEKTPHHERWAEGWERFAMEGKAPSLGLREVFGLFRSWLKTIYQKLTALDVKMTDEVRQVMGRMIASDEAIAEAQTVREMGLLFRNAEEAGMSVEAFREYQALGDKATEEARAELQARSLRDMKWLRNARSRELKRIQAEVDDLRRETDAEARSEIMRMPVYQAWQFLTGGIQDASAERIAGRLDLQSLKSAGLPDGVIDRLVELGMTANDGLHQDVAASLFGYESGDQMVREIAEALPPDVYVQNYSDLLMLSRYGDIASAEAMQAAADEAVHNAMRARVIAAEIKAIDAATRAGDGQRSTAELLVEAAKDYAAKVIGGIRIRDLRPEQYGAAEARAAREAKDAMGKDVAAASRATRTRLFNNAASGAAYAAKREIATAREFFKKVAAGSNEKLVERGRDPDVVAAARQLLAAYGLTSEKRGDAAAAYFAAVEQYDPEIAAVLRGRVDALIGQAKDWRELTIDEFRDLRDQVDALWSLSKRMRQSEVDGRLIDKQEATEALVARMAEIGVPKEMPGERSAVTPKERAFANVRTFIAAARRVENWVERMDGGKSAAVIGAFRRYVFQPVKDAADAYRAAKADYLRQFRDIVGRMDLGQGAIHARELGYTFGMGPGNSGKAELIHAILHTGNDSNKRKLLLGRGWATLDAAGNLDTRRWDSFVRRMVAEGQLKPADFEAVQQMWDLFESMKPKAQEAHRARFGRFFDEVTAKSFTIEFADGPRVFRGGYAPAVVDTEIAKDAEVRKLAESENAAMAYAFPTTPRGFTKARVEYNRPLLLDLRSLTGHIDKVLLFSYLENPVADVKRLLSSREVSQDLFKIDPEAAKLLDPWLNRAAKQLVETPTPRFQNIMRPFSVLRRNAGMAAMFGNVINAAQQVTGFSIAAVRVPPKYILQAMAKWTTDPRGLARSVADLSPYMASRMENEVAIANDQINEILLNPNVYQKGVEFTRRHAYFLQSAVDNVMSPIIWTAAYNNAVKNGSDDADAIRLADAAVRTTQGSTLPEDVSSIETGNAFVRLFTQFMGYYNMQANLLGTEFANIAREMGLRKGLGRGLGVFTLGFLVPALVSEMIVQAFRGGPGDEDKDGEFLDDWLASLFGGVVRSTAALVPVAGPAAVAGFNMTNNKPYDDRISTSPAISMIESSMRGAVDLTKIALTDQELKQRNVRDIATLISMTLGVPVTSALARPIGYGVGVERGDIVPTSELDFARGLVTGSASPESKR